MTTVTFIFSVCLLLFAAGFVACEANEDDTDGPSYEEVLKNSMNRFLTRGLRSRLRMRDAGMNLDKILLYWRSRRNLFNVEMNNASLTIDPNYYVTGVSLRGYFENSLISLVFELKIPEIAIKNVTWILIGTWHEEWFNQAWEFPIVYKNMSARMQIDVELKEDKGNNFWHTKNTFIDIYDSLLNDPAEPIPMLDELSNDFPVRRLQVEMKRGIATQVEATLRTFFEDLFRKCPWKRLMFGRF